MKKLAIFILTLFLVAVLLCLLCGCSDGRTVQHDWNRLMLIERYKDFDVYADTQTGVEYLVHPYNHLYGIAPVLNPDGTPVLAPNFDAREDRP